ncbi:MAG TPA: ABC transporter substrate-binding protein [Caldimonas sp.]
MNPRGIAAAVGTRLAPTGVVRAAINLGNPVLAGIDPASGEPRGVSIDLARELGRQLGVEVELVIFDTAGKSVAAVTQERADVGFFAVDPERGAAIAFTAPYLLIEGCYLVGDDSPLRDNDDVDRAGHVVVVGQGSAYDLHLSRALKLATIVRSPTSAGVVDDFLARSADVAAGVRQQLEADAVRIGGVRLLDGRFMVIRQAMATPSSRGDAAAQSLGRFVEEMKASGFVTRALARHGIQGATVAPPEGGPASG